SGFDYSIWARATATQICWLQGRPDQAAQATRDVLADAEAESNPVSLCHALAWTGCRISLWRGDLESAERSVARLKEQASRLGVMGYYACGLGFEGALAAKRGDVAAGTRLLRACLDGFGEALPGTMYTRFLGIHAEILMAAGDVNAGMTAVDEALKRT